MRTARFAFFTKEYILSITKIVDSNGCWLSRHKPKDNGYINVTINKKKYYLHRVVLCLWNGINYYNRDILALHKCNNKPCFNSEHIKSGSKSDNATDSIMSGTHYNTNKDTCFRCGRQYQKYKTRINGKLVWRRKCRFCSVAKNKERRRLAE